jgi:hypothetical protein
MPRRWKRKRPKIISPIDILLRNANPLRSEIEDEPDPRKREERQRECDIARDELMRMYRNWLRGASHIDFQVRVFCEQQIVKNGGHMPPPLNTGRPPDKDRRLLIAVHVQEAIKASGGKREASRQPFGKSRSATEPAMTTSGTSISTVILTGVILLQLS